jgi:hypothetical protein
MKKEKLELRANVAAAATSPTIKIDAIIHAAHIV